MKLKTIAKCAALALTLCVSSLQAQDSITTKPRLTIGGYGEAVYTRNFYSDNMFRYSHAERYRDAKGHGRIDLPHVVINLGYDFGKGFNIRVGHIIVPVGQTNNAHLPTEFFTCYRPEGEFNIMPCTWHETGVSLWGRAGAWRYEVQVLPALNSNLFTESGWVHNGSASPYEFRPANSLAGAARVDYMGIRNLRLSLSGYVGNSFNNDITTAVYSETSRYRDALGTVLIGAFDFDYRNAWLVVRGNCDYGYLGDAGLISTRNKNQTTMTGNPYPHTAVGKGAYDYSLEAGVDLLAWTCWRHGVRHLYLFGRYDRYDSFIPATGFDDIGWTERQVLSAGINYYPLKHIAIKAEAGVRQLNGNYNDEPFVALGITWVNFNFAH